MILLSCASNNANTIHYIESCGRCGGGGPLADKCGDRVPGILMELLE
jgi:hypothetical protein